MTFTSTNATTNPFTRGARRRRVLFCRKNSVRDVSRGRDGLFDLLRAVRPVRGVKLSRLPPLSLRRPRRPLQNNRTEPNELSPLTRLRYPSSSSSSVALSHLTNPNAPTNTQAHVLSNLTCDCRPERSRTNIHTPDRVPSGVVRTKITNRMNK